MAWPARSDLMAAMLAEQRRARELAEEVARLRSELDRVARERALFARPFIETEFTDEFEETGRWEVNTSFQISFRGLMDGGTFETRAEAEAAALVGLGKLFDESEVIEPAPPADPQGRLFG